MFLIHWKYSEWGIMIFFSIIHLCINFFPKKFSLGPLVLVKTDKSAILTSCHSNYSYMNKRNFHGMSLKCCRHDFLLTVYKVICTVLLLQYFYCPLPFRRKARRHGIGLSVVPGAWRVMRGSEFVVGTLWVQLLLQFWTDPCETWQVF